MAVRNVHKDEISIIKLPTEAISEDRGLSNCGTPERVVASLSDAVYYKNDRTSFAYIFDSMTVELEDSNGALTTAPGTAITFPYQSDAVGFCIDWRQVESGGVLLQGCYRVKITWTKDGNTDYFYYGSFQLLEYNWLNVAGTVRIFVVLNGLVRKQGINYKDSGFAGTIRFRGFFGDMQPNYDTENIRYTDRIGEMVRNEAVRTYSLKSAYLLHCMTRRIDEEHLLAANQIYISDHNSSNHKQDYFDFPVILSQEESPKFDYTGTVYASISALFEEKVQVSESKYDGNIKGSTNVILSLPTVVNECVTTFDVNVNDVDEGSGTSALPLNVTLTDGVTDITPTSSSLVGNDLTIVAPRATWTRPADWLEIDSLVDASMHRWVGLAAIEDDDTKNYFSFLSSQAYTIELDGVATNFAAGVRANYQVLWASVSAGTETSEGFRQVIFKAYPQVGNWTGTFYAGCTRLTAPLYHNHQFLDIKSSLPNVALYLDNYFDATIQLYLKKVTHLHPMPFTLANFFRQIGVEQVSMDFSTATSLATMLYCSGGKIELNSFTTVATSMASFAAYSATKSFGDITANSVITGSTAFYSMPNLTDIGNVSMTSLTTATNLAVLNPNWVNSGIWTFGAGLTSLAGAFSINPKLLELIIQGATGLTNISTIAQANSSMITFEILSDMFNVTNTTNALLFCNNLLNLTLTGLRVGITIPPCRMNDAAFANTFNSLGMASGAQTITKTGNVLCSAPTLAIATGKGYTVVE